MKILVTICARGGSKGIPGKNIKELCGKPLIGYTIDLASAFAHKHNVDIELSTDSEQIKHVATQCGLSSLYNRPEILAGDDVGKIDVIADILQWSEDHNDVRYDYILDLDVTSPLRTLQDLETAFEMIESDRDALNLFSVNTAARNPYFCVVERKENGYYDKVKSVGNVLSRQTAPAVYDLNGAFYFYRRRFFEQGYKGAITDRSLIYQMPHVCFDLDHPIDFEFMSFLIQNDKLDFELCKHIV